MEYKYLNVRTTQFTRGARGATSSTQINHDKHFESVYIFILYIVVQLLGGLYQNGDYVPSEPDMFRVEVTRPQGDQDLGSRTLV